MNTASSISLRAGLCFAVGAVFFAALGRIHLRVQTTVVGYEIGRLKAQEGRLLEDRSELRLELAKMTTRQNLTMMLGDDAATKTATAANSRSQLY